MTTRLLLLFALLALLSCRKSRDTFVEGHVYTYGTTTKATNKELTINLYSARGGDRLEMEGKTDTNGYFSFEFTPDRGDNTLYFLRLLDGAPRHHPVGYNPLYLEMGEQQVMNINLSPHAWLKLHIENVNPQPGDVFSVNWGGGVFLRFDGQLVNEEVTLMGGGNNNRIITFNLKRNNQYSIIKDTVWMTAWDTVYHKVEY